MGTSSKSKKSKHNGIKEWRKVPNDKLNREQRRSR